MPTPPLGGDCSGALPRQEVRELTGEQWQRLIAAIRTLQERATPQTASAYDRLSLIHNRFATAGRIHQTASFLPWHRLFLRAYEYELQQIDPSVTVPYWDWTRDSQRLANAPFWSSDLFGGNGRGAAGIVRDGAFADWVPFRGPFAGAGRRTIGLTRTWGNDSGLETAAAAPAIARVLRRAKTYDALRQGLEIGGHGDVHIAVGGDMADFFSPNDPVFWLHHAFIDKLWMDWQALPGRQALSYGGPTIRGPDRAKLSDALDGFEDVTVGDVIAPSSLCVTYTRSTVPLETVTTLRASASTVRPDERVTYIATISSAQRGTVDFERGAGGGPLCTNVKPVFAVNTWTAVCEVNARRLRGGGAVKTIEATYRGGAGELASSDTVKLRVAPGNPTVLWTPAITIAFGTPLGPNLDAFESVPGRKRFTVLKAPAPEVPVAPDTILDAGYQVLRLRYEPRKGPAQLLTRRIVVTPGTLKVIPTNLRITSGDPVPPLEFTISGFVAGETPASLTGFEQPICRAARPEGTRGGRAAAGRDVPDLLRGRQLAQLCLRHHVHRRARGGRARQHFRPPGPGAAPRRRRPGATASEGLFDLPHPSRALRRDQAPTLDCSRGVRPQPEGARERTGAAARAPARAAAWPARASRALPADAHLEERQTPRGPHPGGAGDGRAAGLGRRRSDARVPSRHGTAA